MLYYNLETFRMHPPVPLLIRVCTKTFKIPDSDVVLNPKEKIIIPVYPIHNDPKYYPQPEIFDPQRFSDENKASRPRGTFLPFGDGPRICIGNNMSFYFLLHKCKIFNSICACFFFLNRYALCVNGSQKWTSGNIIEIRSTTV